MFQPADVNLLPAISSVIHDQGERVVEDRNFGGHCGTKSCDPLAAIMWRIVQPSDRIHQTSRTPMLAFGASAGHISWLHRPHLALGPHFLGWKRSRLHMRGNSMVACTHIFKESKIRRHNFWENYLSFCIECRLHVGNWVRLFNGL